MIVELIPAALDGERVDRIVALTLGSTRTVAAAVVAAGGVEVDGVATTVGKVRVRTGQTVSIDESLIPAPTLPHPQPEVPVDVVLADADVIVVNKRAGQVVHPGAGNPDGTLVNGLLAEFPEIATVGEAHRPGIVHRLDVGTSGLLVVARSAEAYDALVSALSARLVARTYTALVWGHPQNPRGVVDAPIGRDLRDPQRMAVSADGKPARTGYAVDVQYTDPVDVALLTCQLETGRTHQIRVHLAAIDHPVVGDGTYGGIRPGLACPRPFLHATALGFDHPISGTRMEFSVELPADLSAVLASLSC